MRKAILISSPVKGAPWLLAHKSMLAVNKPKKVSVNGADYVLWQDRTGKVNALPNACPHMANPPVCAGI